MRKKFIAGAAVLALLMNSPQASADEIVIFGEEFGDEVARPAPKKVDKPAKVKEPAPASEHTVIVPKKAPPKDTTDTPEKPVEPVQPIEQPTEPVEPPQPIEKPDVEKLPPSTQTQPVEQPTEPVEPPQPVEKPDVEKLPPSTQTQPVEQPTEPIEPPQPVEQPEIVEQLPPTTEVDRPFTQSKISGEQEKFDKPITQQPQPKTSTRQSTQSQHLQTAKQRFIKLAVDETYTYYLDKNSVQWKKMPYSTSEYMADVWVRLVERTPRELSDDMAAYGADSYNAEVALAREQGIQYSPEDLKVLRSQAYVLEHYYLRPKTNQIQFLCELEVFGRPQNTINERAYDYRNWENLVPGSIESIIYAATIKIIGKGKADPKGHMTFFDMLDEYARIAL